MFGNIIGYKKVFLGYVYIHVRNIFHYLMILPMWHIFLNSDLLKFQSVSGAQGNGPQYLRISEN